jgi:hypothetical protein
LYPELIAGFVQCGRQQPLHHTAYVLQFLATILIGLKRSAEEMSIGILAALLHDVAQGESTVPKITEKHLQERVREVVKVEGKQSADELRRYLNEAVKGRREHMAEGEEFARRILRRVPLPPSSAVVDKIADLIKRHDEPKIPVADETVREELRLVGEQWSLDNAIDLDDPLLEEDLANCLIKPSDEDWLLQYLHEADLLWMLTQDGVEADLARKAPTKRDTPLAMLEYNAGLHRKEVRLYETYRKAEYDQYGFKRDDGGNLTIYRSETGILLFRHLVNATASAFGTVPAVRPPQ